MVFRRSQMKSTRLLQHFRSTGDSSPHKGVRHYGNLLGVNERFHLSTFKMRVLHNQGGRQPHAETLAEKDAFRFLWSTSTLYLLWPTCRYLWLKGAANRESEMFTASLCWCVWCRTQWACGHMHGHMRGGTGDTLTVIHCLLCTLKTYCLSVSDKLAGWHSGVLVTAAETAGQHDLFTAEEEFTICLHIHHSLCARMYVRACVSVENHSVLCITSLSYWTIGCFTKPTLHTPATPGLSGETETRWR